MGPEKLISFRGIEDYFFHQVRGACANQNLIPSPHTEYYLVRMLSDFCHRNSLDVKGHDPDAPLAIRYLSSYHEDEEDQFHLLKHLGDFTLYTTGFFQDSLSKQLMDIEYFFTLGGSAYHRLHCILDRRTLQEAFCETFLELSSSFAQFAEVLCEISENSNISKSSDLLRLYEKWLVTKSQRLLKKLNDFGIFPSSLPPTSSSN